MITRGAVLSMVRLWGGPPGPRADPLVALLIGRYRRPPNARSVVLAVVSRSVRAFIQSALLVFAGRFSGVKYAGTESNRLRAAVCAVADCSRVGLGSRCTFTDVR